MRRENYSELLNCPATIDDETVENLKQFPIITALERPPSNIEVSESIKQLINNKPPGSDGIPAEIFIHGDQSLIQELTNLFGVIWETGSVPSDL